MSPPFTLADFVAESNRIEGIPEVRVGEVEAHERFLAAPIVTVHSLWALVLACANASLRDTVGMDVRIGQHYPPRGGPEIPRQLDALLNRMGRLTPFAAHQEYETLHPFMDANGRSGRALWLHMMGGIDRAPLGFLHTWYYQSLDAGRP